MINVERNIMGCGAHCCHIAGQNTGQATNGPCGCLKSLSTADRIVVEKALWKNNGLPTKLLDAIESVLKQMRALDKGTLQMTITKHGDMVGLINNGAYSMNVTFGNIIEYCKEVKDES